MLTMRVNRKLNRGGRIFPVYSTVGGLRIVGEIVCGQHTKPNVRHRAISQGAEFMNFANSNNFSCFPISLVMIFLIFRI